MELLRQVSNTQLLYPAAAVAVVLLCAALVFMFGFHSAEQPQFDKLPLVLDDKKSSNKKRKTKEKKSSPNRTVSDGAKAKNEIAKKSPAKEKKDEQPKEVEKVKPKEKVEPKVVKKEVPIDAKKGKKGKQVTDVEKPADFDDGGWQEVPKKSEKKKAKGAEEKDKKESPAKKESPTKKDSPSKKLKKKGKDVDVEAGASSYVEEPPQEETIKIVSSVGPEVNEEEARALQAQIEEVQRVLKEAERRDQGVVSVGDEESPEDEVNDVKDLRSNKKKENKEKQKKKASEATAAVAKNAAKSEERDNSDSSDKKEEQQTAPVFDELGDTWTDAKVTKKSKKKARKDQ